MAAAFPLVHDRGDDFTRTIRVVDGNGDPVDLTGYVVDAAVRETSDLSSAVLAEMVIAQDDPAGEVALSIPRADLSDVDERAYYHVRATTGGLRRTWLAGPFRQTTTGSDQGDLLVLELVAEDVISVEVASLGIGHGIPAGGSSGQLLAKLSGSDFEVGWQTVAGVAPPAYVHTQAAPSTAWTVVHGLGFNPAVTILDSADGLVEGELVFTDINNLVINLSTAISGKAYLS